jgi:hypothetical protein
VISACRRRRAATSAWQKRAAREAIEAALAAFEAAGAAGCVEKARAELGRMEGEHGPRSLAGAPRSFRSDATFTRTTNSGASWEPARAIFRPRANQFSIGHQIVVLSDGTLVDGRTVPRLRGQQEGPGNRRADLGRSRRDLDRTHHRC